MAGWQRAAEIPGLFSGASRPTRGSALRRSAGRCRRLWRRGAVDRFRNLGFLTWRSLVLLHWLGVRHPGAMGHADVFPVDTSRVRVPERPNLGFTGRAIRSGTCSSRWSLRSLSVRPGPVPIAAICRNRYRVQSFLSWLTVRWFVSNLGSNGQPLGLSFTGSRWAYIGWHVLATISGRHNRRLGVGLHRAGFAGYAEISAARSARSHSTVRAWRFSGVDPDGDRRLQFIIPIPWMYRWCGAGRHRKPFWSKAAPKRTR